MNPSRWLLFLCCCVGVFVVTPQSCSQPPAVIPVQESNREPHNQIEHGSEPHTNDAGGSETVPENKPSNFIRWPTTQRPALNGSLLTDFPWLKNVSSWSSPGCGTGQPNQARFMGDYAVGNGYSFSLAGYACPLHTLHAMVGPTYQKDGGFFADTWMEVFTDGKKEPLKIQQGHILRVKKTPILITQESMGDIEIQTVTWAPMGNIESALLKQHVILRMIQIRNVSQREIKGVTLQFRKANDKLKQRQRSLLFLPPHQTPTEQEPALAVGAVKPNQETRVTVAYVLTNGEENKEAITKALEKSQPTTLLNQTRQHWEAWLSKATQLITPDSKVNDLYTGMLVTTLVQRTSLGAVSPMSRYTNFWTRDIVGPVRLWLRAGLFAEVKTLLEFYYKAASAKGVLSNSYSLTLPEKPGPPPDWKNLPSLKGRTAAEAPSYLSLMHHWYTQTTGDRELVRAHYPMLYHSIVGQDVRQNGLLPFSGDETYRTALSMTLGLSLTHKFEECCDSTNSSILFVAGASSLAQEARLLNYDDDANQFERVAQSVRDFAEKKYWNKEGYYLPFLDRTTPKRYPPYPDISTKALWTGYHQPDDLQALQHVREMVKQMGKPDGMWQLPTAATYKNYLGFGLGDGIYTGMTPGYVLSNLTMLEHPTAEKLFNTLAKVVSSSGNVAEYQVYSDHSAFQFLYDKSGRQSGDTSARFRPWEGGILIDAMLFYLLGRAPDAKTKTLSLVPRLPNQWPHVEWRNLRFGAHTFDLSMQDKDSTLSIQLKTSSKEAIKIQLSIPLKTHKLVSVQLNQTLLSEKEYTEWKPFDWLRIKLPEHDFSQSKPMTVIVKYK